CNVGTGCPDSLDMSEIVTAPMAAVHRLENAVAARLCGQMEIGHELSVLAERANEIGAHVAGMTGGEAQALDSIDLGESVDEPRQRPDFTVRSHAMIGIDILAEQRDFAHSRFGKRPGFTFDLHDRTRSF